MDNKELNILIVSLKAQVNVLEAKIRQVHKTAKTKKLSDFYGILAKFGETSEDEINAVRFKLRENIL